MRRGRPGFLPIAIIASGVFILLALVLPNSFWWFLLASGLIAFGIWLLRC